MSKARNVVISGDYIGWRVQGGGLFRSDNLKIQPLAILLTVELSGCHLMSHDEIVNVKRTFGKAALFSIPFGDLGLLHGLLTAKPDNVYVIECYFKDGKQCIIEADDRCYEVLSRTFGI